jgi:hypothetical protein
MVIAVNVCRQAFAASALTLCALGSAASQVDTLLGVWEGGAESTRAKYGNIRIGAEFISFSFDRNSWKCRTKYLLVAEGLVATDPELARLVPTSTHHYIKLEMGKSACTSSTHFVLIIPTDTPDYLGLVELRGGSWSGTGHFHRYAGALQSPDLLKRRHADE